MSQLKRVRFQYGILVPSETPEQAIHAVAEAMRQNPYAYIFGVEEATFDQKPTR